MEKLTELLGFEARYVIYPLITLLIAGFIHFGFLRFLRKWFKKTEITIGDPIIHYLESLLIPLLLLITLYYLSHLLPLTDSNLKYTEQGLVIAAIFLLVFFSARFVSTIIGMFASQRENLERFRKPLLTLTYVLFLLVGVALFLKIFNISLSETGIRFIRIIGIIVGGYVLLRIINLAVIQMENLVEDQDTSTVSEAEKRAKTLGKIINSAGFVLVIGVGIMMIMSELGMDIMPLITGAGIAGLAIGFGAQNLVRDVISGFFLILEDQIRVGDVAQVNGTSGVVEAIKLRITVLRDLQGTVHIVPNGEIKQVANMTKEYSYYVINVGIAYKENVDQVMDILKSVGEELRQDPDLRPFILDQLEILGVDDFAESQVTIKIRIKTVPLKQWMIGRELRRRIKNTFDSKGIEIPFPHISVYFGEASKPFDLSMQSIPKDTGAKT